ncbi:ATP-binding cassette domain-containing protein [Treponema sp.]|uniref:ATP-binding cassette domain-containing protein n=1 Tax=Treponema sp. TaxID=166 RepID=UPI00298E4AAE|nr:ATP-binding cassette domain-containing protein [Treponema sp.]MCR5612504.1 ATP-binding cassette domain-containing protein [Treponema sp.]
MSILLENISKQFEKKTALYDVNLTFSKGKIHALVGENGAGKSTLAKILCARFEPTSGNVRFTENEKVCIVEQRPLVAESLTVRQNIFLGIKENRKNILRLNELIKTWCPTLNLNSTVKDIGAGERFYTSLLNCLLHPFDTLVLDEPAAYLDNKARADLFCGLESLKKDGVCIIVITHSKTEIMKYADEIFLLQKGIVKEKFFDVQKKTEEQKKQVLSQIENSIKESSIKIKTQEKNSCTNTTALESENSSVVEHERKSAITSDCAIYFNNITSRPLDKPMIQNVSLCVKSGTVNFIRGLAEAGLLTLEDCICGMGHKPESGEFIFEKRVLAKKKLKDENDNREDLNTASTLKRISVKKINPKFLRVQLAEKLNLKIAIIPSDKTMRGSNPELTVEQMLYCVNARNFSSAEYKGYVLAVIKKSGVQTRPQDKVKTLSGGMLQHLMLERELYFNPDILFLCEPFAGLDMQKLKIMCARIAELKKEGKGILILSKEKVSVDFFDSIMQLEGGRLIEGGV